MNIKSQVFLPIVKFLCECVHEWIWNENWEKTLMTHTPRIWLRLLLNSFAMVGTKKILSWTSCHWLLIDFHYNIRIRNDNLFIETLVMKNNAS